jgi:hypothetical protein
MSVCATCREAGLTPGQPHTCRGPQFADLMFTRHRGKAITIDSAPARTRISVQALVDRYAYLTMPRPDVVVFADQVVYRVTGWDLASRSLELELLEDMRPAAQPVQDGAVCAAYQAPTEAEDSGLCARCGMADYKHREQQA